MEKKPGFTIKGFVGETPTAVLTNGKLLFNKYGKYQPDLTILVPNETSLATIPRFHFDAADFNLSSGVTGFFGRYFKSKKGTDCFEVSDDPETSPHILLIDDWGGAFCSYRGRELFKLPNLYQKRASSNGGGTGYDYVVIEKGAKYTLSEDDI